MKKKIITVLVTLILAFSLNACGVENNTGKNESFKIEQQKNEEVVLERGKLDGNVYTNENMGIQVMFPEGCTMYSDEELAQELGEDGNSSSGYIYDVEAAMPDQSTTIQIFLEDTDVTNIIKMDAEAYAKMLLRNLKAGYSQAGIQVNEEKIIEKTLGGADFTIVSIMMEGMTQEYYIHEVDGCMISFIVTSTEGWDAQEFLDTIKAL
ncbi:hypothetical protein [Roseburia sp. 499]|uniref:hypothetical protein n=1 Tax=Roseburia sp. 499 TaxID=1261634 RepID=UPI000950D1AD|nr:hypothetical protein [Roseburia sp. 499]WVK69612.1 hypothetical protein BIV20_14880 [Roseburia sp. 499]